VGSIELIRCEETYIRNASALIGGVDDASDFRLELPAYRVK
jgi:hypothetical protein